MFSISNKLQNVFCADLRRELQLAGVGVGGGAARPQEQKTCANNSPAQSCQTRTGTRSNTFPTSTRPPHPPIPPRCRRRRERRSAEVGTGSRSAERSSPFVRTNPQTIPGPAGRHSCAREKPPRVRLYRARRPTALQRGSTLTPTDSRQTPPSPFAHTPGLNSITASQKKFYVLQ